MHDTGGGAKTAERRDDPPSPPPPNPNQVLNGTEVVWQRPAADSHEGVLLTFHGCGHGAVDFFPKSAGCPKCIGLAEEVNITRTALARGLALVAVSSADRDGSRCWDASKGSEDVLAVRGCVGWWGGVVDSIGGGVVAG